LRISLYISALLLP